MEDKRGFGKNGRREGYKGVSRGSAPAGAGGAGPADGRGGRAVENRGGRPADFRGGRTSEVQSGKSNELRGGKPSAFKSGRTAEFKGEKAMEFKRSRTAGSKGGRTAELKRERTMESTSGRPSYDRFAGSADFRGSRATDSRGAEYKAAKYTISKEENMPAAEEFTSSRGDLDKLEGRNSILEALKSGRSINRIFVAKGEREGSINQIIAMARQSHILIQEIDRAKLDAMSATHSHQGIIALTAAKDYVELDDILESAAASGRPPFLIILDEITDSHNLGSILRTANAAGVHGVIIPKRRAVGLTSVVSKASAGAIEYVPVARVTNIVQTIESLKKQNIWVVGTDSTGEKAYFDADLTGPIALVIGSEGEGMGKLVRESCDFVVKLPMMGQISSLNAAVAGAIVTYEILRQRSKKKP